MLSTILSSSQTLKKDLEYYSFRGACLDILMLLPVLNCHFSIMLLSPFVIFGQFSLGKCLLKQQQRSAKKEEERSEVSADCEYIHGEVKGCVNCLGHPPDFMTWKSS